MTDAEIIKRVKAGRVDDFSLLVEKYHSQLLSFIYKIVRDGDVAEDIGQEVFMQIYKSLNQFEEDRGTPFTAWLYITARNEAISALRRRKTPLVSAQIDSQDYGCSVEQQLIVKEEMELLCSSLTQLPEPYKTTLVRSLQGRSMKEIAKMESVSAGTVKSRIHRAKILLTGLMKNYLQGI